MRTTLKIIGVVIIALVLGVFMTTSCSSIGSVPQGNDQSRIEKSKNWDKDREKFVNRLPEEYDKMREKAMSVGTVKEFFFGGEENKSPKLKLPEIRPNLNDFLSPSDDIKAIWFGHSSILINISGKNILIDPVFSSNASPVCFMVGRFQDPVLSLDELPEIDYIVITHDHYDHLDMSSIKYFNDKKAKFLTPLGVGSHIKGWGINENRITELDWWDSKTFSNIEFIATPSQHFSGRGLNDAGKTLWASWVIRNERQSIYLSGDSGYDIHFKEIGEKFGPFDLAFIENGQYNERWEAVHMLPQQTAQAYFDLKAKRMVPIHWGMFVLSLHSWYSPIESIHKLADMMGINLITPKYGQIIYANDSNNSESWWKEYVPREMVVINE